MTEATAGSSGLYSTATDMAIWLRYLLGTAGLPQRFQSRFSTTSFRKLVCPRRPCDGHYWGYRRPRIFFEELMVHFYIVISKMLRESIESTI